MNHTWDAIFFALAVFFCALDAFGATYKTVKFFPLGVAVFVVPFFADALQAAT